MPELSGTVGYDGSKKGDNKVHDVCLVQAMLKILKSKKGTSYVSFGYDGTLGKDKGTHKAIIAFQNDHGTLKNNNQDKSGLLAKDGLTFKKMVSLLPADKKKLRAIDGLKFVYLEGTTAAKNSAESAVQSNTKFLPGFRTALAKLIRDMYTTYGIVLSVVPGSGGFRTFDDQSKLYAKGRVTGTKGKTVTGAGPGESNHNFGNGADIGMDGLMWLATNGTITTDAAWLNALERAKPTVAAKLWQLRNKLTTLHPSARKGDLIHLQSFSDAKVSMRASLVNLLNHAGSMNWTHASGEYQCDYGLGGTIFNIGRGTSNAQAIWKQTCDVSGTNLAAALNDAHSRREKSSTKKLPAKQEAIYADLISAFTKPPKFPIKSSDLLKAHYNKMREWLKKDFDLAEADYTSWAP